MSTKTASPQKNARAVIARALFFPESESEKEA
jgi:hypothetical protein